jgi:hypothetical protein
MARTKRPPEFGWKNQRIGGSGDAVGKHLRVLEKRYGALTPELIVEEARPADSPLHRYFEWDDTAAAEAYRREQARGLLRAVVMESPAEPGVHIRAFVNIQGQEGGAYVNTIRAMSDEQMAEQILVRALAELRSFKAKYQHLDKLRPVLMAIDKVS